VRTALEEELEAEMTEAMWAEKGERTAGRLGYRSGYYGPTLITRIGKLELRVPQDRAGRFSTELFERYQRSERALVAALAEMYDQGDAEVLKPLPGMVGGVTGQPDLHGPGRLRLRQCLREAGRDIRGSFGPQQPVNRQQDHGRFPGSCKRLGCSDR
jgi:hypothetical protein